MPFLSSSIFLVPPFDEKVVARFERERETFLKCGKMVKIVGKKRKERKKSSSKNRAGEKQRERERERDVFRVHTDMRDTRVMMRLLYE